MDAVDKKTITNRLLGTKLKWQFDAHFEEVRKRLSQEQGGRDRNREAVRNAAWEEAWAVFEPAVRHSENERRKREREQEREREQKREQQANSEPTTPRLSGMPERTTDAILDPNYSEPDRGKQIRDGLLWAAMEFDRVIEDTDDGPVAHLQDASVPPPNAFAIGVIRTYALSPTEKRRDLIGRALGFASKGQDEATLPSSDDGAFLHELG